jgi:hypothetical protein
MRRLFESRSSIDAVMRNTFAIILKPILAGWAVCLTDGRELARFRGPGAHFRALRYLNMQLAPGSRALGL